VDAVEGGYPCVAGSLFTIIESRVWRKVFRGRRLGRPTTLFRLTIGPEKPGRLVV
jgi:hypothetical protein